MEQIKELAKKAKEASRELATMSTERKDAILRCIADALVQNTDYILQENRKDMESAQQAGKSVSFLDRLALNEERVAAMADGLREVAALADPSKEVIEGFTRPNGLVILKKRVPIGVIGIIYEARPNVTADAIGLCLKTGNAVILKGGSDAIYSNIAITEVANHAARQAGLPQGAIALIENTSREATQYFMRLNGLIDVLIPRGGAGLIRSVVEHATIPVIETGTGNCHIYVDQWANQRMALDIIVNAKTSRPGVCNAAETVLVHAAIADQFMPKLVAVLSEKGVEMRGCKRAAAYGNMKVATDEDFATEFLDYILAIKIVDSIEEAVAHINYYGTRHSEAIVTALYDNARYFQEAVDAAAVYVNASTRFTDGGEFGFGAEIGISTQKLHARGPMGLKELTTYKYLIQGDGQIR